MLNLVIRCTIMYIFVIGAVRLMGKRQIGELQPSELVVTILISDIASMPLQNTDIPLIDSVMCLSVLVLFEVIISILSIKFKPVRKLLQGNSILVIENGKLNEDYMRMIRYTADDLMEALRLKDCFDISQVQYAYIETNGSLSVKLKPDYRNVVAKDLGIKNKSTSIPCVVISDGKIERNEFKICNMTEEKLQKILKKSNLKEADIFVMTADSEGKIYYKEKK